jgi:zinc transport system substrate-binding protein
VAQDPERAVIFSHPVYEYLSRRYDLHGPSLDWEPDATPTAEQWNDLEQIATLHGADWMIWEGDPLPSTLQGLNELDVRSVVFDPCGNRPEDGDLLTVLAAGAESLERVFGSRD